MPDDYPATVATTGVVTVGGSRVNGIIDEEDDQDWFSVILNAGTTYEFTLNGATNGLSDPFLFLYDSSGAQLDYNDDGGDGLNSLITYSPTASGTFYLGASAYGSNTGAYTVGIASTGTDDYPATTATTGVVTVDSTAGTTGTIGANGDVDWFAVSLNGGTTYQFTVAGSGTSRLSDPYLSLYRATGSDPIAYDDDGGEGLNPLITYSPTSAGTYYLAVRGYGDNTGGYTVTASSGGDEYAGNSSTSGVAVVDTPAAGEINFAGDADWFRLDLTVGRTYTIRLRGSPSGVGTLTDPYFQGVYDSNGVLVDGTTNDDYGDTLESQTTFTPATSGTYYFAAAAFGSNTGTYQLQVTGGVAVADTPGNASSTATLTAGSAHDMIGTVGDVDWFRASLVAGHTYVFEQTGDQTTSNPLNDPLIRGIYDSNGRLLPNTTNDDYGFSLNSHVQFTPASSGTYYLGASAFGSNQGSYVVTLEERTNDEDRISHDPGTRGTITLGSNGVDGEINNAFDIDWYAVQLTANQAYEINLGGADSGMGDLLDPLFVGVFDRSGEMISGTGNDDAYGTLDSQTVFRPRTTGIYYLAAGGYGDLTGTYNLSIETSTSTDLADNAMTTGSVSPGSSVESRIDTPEDVDWIRVNLTGGSTYRIQQQGSPTNRGSLSDPLIWGVFDAEGQVLDDSYSDDDGFGFNAEVLITAPATGSYYIAAGAYGSNTGSYTVDVSNANQFQDDSLPGLEFTSLSDDSQGIPVNSNLSLAFTENVRPGSGFVNVTGGGQTFRIPTTSRQVSFNGRVMTINPSSSFRPNVSYQLSLDANAVRDLAGNRFAGLQNNSSTRFTTARQTAAGQDSWTVLVYMAADNNLEEYAINDLNEMEMVNLPGSVNVVTMLDRIDGYDNSNGNWTTTRRGVVTRDNNPNTVSSFSRFTDLGELNTGDPGTLRDFINWGVNNYRADHYALVIWDHGGGLSGSSWDDTNGGANISPNELRQAIQGSAVDRFDVIGFDACLMGMTEQAWDLRDLTDVYIGSEEIIPGQGWAYDRWLNTLRQDPTMTATDLGTAIVSSYGDEYQGQSNVTLSALRTRDLNALNTALNNFVRVASGAQMQVLRTAAGDALTFPNNESMNYRDLGSFMAEVADNTTNATLRNRAEEVLQALDRAVFAREGTVANASGLSIYAPYGTTPVSTDFTARNHSFLSASNWEVFLGQL